MYKGKYQKPTAKGRRKKPGILVISLLLLTAVIVGGTVAYLVDSTGNVTNTFSPAEVKIQVNEKQDGFTKENITFTNLPKEENPNAVPVYIRATLVVYWKDTFDATDDGLDNPTENIIAKPEGASVEIGETQENWFMVGDVYYYENIVAPGVMTTTMTDVITVTIPEGSTAKCYIDVRAEAIQANPADAVEGAWLDVKVSDGMLTRATD